MMFKDTPPIGSLTSCSEAVVVLCSFIFNLLYIGKNVKSTVNRVMEFNYVYL